MQTSNIHPIDRYKGCLIGLACGDALGGPVEFESRASIAGRYPNGLRDFVGGGWLRLAPGEVTDDTQMTLALAHSLADCGDIDMSDVAARFVAWRAGEPKDIGNTTRSAISKLAAGIPWQNAGELILAERGPDAAAGNGSVMRCAPVALRYRNDREKLRQVSQDTSRVTHAESRCVWGAVAVNQGIAHLLNGGSLEDLVDASIADVQNRAATDCIHSAKNMKVDNVRSGGFVLDTVSAAYWCLFRHDTFEETVVAAVGLGGDADTTAAVAGALAGAHYGIDAVPERWLNLLQPRNELEAVASRLFSQSHRGGSASFK